MGLEILPVVNLVLIELADILPAVIRTQFLALGILIERYALWQCSLLLVKQELDNHLTLLVAEEHPLHVTAHISKVICSPMVSYALQVICAVA